MAKITQKKEPENLITVSKIINLRYFEFEANFIFKKETHSFWELVYVDKGSWEINTDKNKFIFINLKKPTFIVPMVKFLQIFS